MTKVSDNCEKSENECCKFWSETKDECPECHRDVSEDSHIDVLVDCLYQLAGEAQELEARDDVDDHMQHIIEGLRFQAEDVQEWLNEHYYNDPVNVVENTQNGDSSE